MDEQLFQREYQLISDQLYTYLLRATGDREWAADLLQEAALKAYSARGGFRGEATFKTWIYRIAMNTMKNQMARKSRERKWTVQMDHPESAVLETPESLLRGRQEGKVLSRALMVLEDNYRLPFLLRHVDDMSYREIADVLEIEEGAARVRVHRARNALVGMLRTERDTDHEA